MDKDKEILILKMCIYFIGSVSIYHFYNGYGAYEMVFLSTFISTGLISRDLFSLNKK